MGNKRLTLRTWFMMFVAFVITILFIMGSTALWRHNFRELFLFLALGTTLTILFYRKKLAILALVACAWMVANGGLTAIFHPSAVGVLVTLASVVGFILFSRLVNKQYRGLAPDDWQKVFGNK